MNRRAQIPRPALLRRLGATVLALAATSALWAASAAAPLMTTFVYKKVGALEIKADVLPATAAFAGPRPVVVWIHGGALINGSRERDFYEEQTGWLGQLHSDHGVVLIAIDYRLAPESPLSAIVEDIEDAFRWVSEQGPQLFRADPTRIAVAGGSAGGYLALVAGSRVRPALKGVVSCWGYGELLGPWYTEPSTHARHLELRPTAAEAWRQVAGPPVANAAERQGDGKMFYQYCRQHGLWPWAVSGWNPWRDAEKFVHYMPLRNITPAYPPTFLLHGQADTDVPHEQSAMLAAELTRHGVEHRFISVPGAEHGLRGHDPQQLEKIYQSAGEFLLRHLTATPTQ